MLVRIEISSERRFGDRLARSTSIHMLVRIEMSSRAQALPGLMVEPVNEVTSEQVLRRRVINWREE
jgi:hypothetical protein